MKKRLSSININNVVNDPERDFILTSETINTPLGPMVAIADDKALYLLEFLDRKQLEDEIVQIKIKLKASIVSGDTKITRSIGVELASYFLGKLKTFKTPIATIGSTFQKSVWETLSTIHYGTTCSYSDLAKSLGHPTATRAVAKATSANQLAIIIPCHRVINKNSQLGGYSGGLERKKSLIELESVI